MGRLIRGVARLRLTALATWRAPILERGRHCCIESQDNGIAVWVPGQRTVLLIESQDRGRYCCIESQDKLDSALPRDRVPLLYSRTGPRRALSLKLSDTRVYERAPRRNRKVQYM